MTAPEPLAAFRHDTSAIPTERLIAFADANQIRRQGNTRDDLTASVHGALCRKGSRLPAKFDLSFPGQLSSAWFGIGTEKSSPLQTVLSAALDQGPAAGAGIPPAVRNILLTDGVKTTKGPLPMGTFTQAQMDAAVAQARTAERTRISAILDSEEGKARPSAARAAALDTDMTVSAAGKFLARLPAESGNDKSRFEQAMERGGNPDLGAPGEGSEPRSRAQAAVDAAFGPRTQKGATQTASVQNAEKAAHAAMIAHFRGQ